MNNLRTHLKHSLAFWLVCLVIHSVLLPGLGRDGTTLGQFEATVILRSGSTARGEITKFDPKGVTIKSRGSEQEISIDDIRQVTSREEPGWLTTAKARYREDRYDAAYKEFGMNSLDSSDPFVVADAKYHEAMAAAHLALSGNEVTAKQAGNLLLAFIQTYPQSLYLYPATEMFADLASNSGGFKVAAENYEKLQNADSDLYQSRSLLKLGKAKLYSGQAEDAVGVFRKVTRQESANDTTKLLAQCFLAQAMSYNGKADEALEIIDNIIKNENSAQTDLFARAYNAKGICFINKNDLKAAQLAFMHTHLLFFTDRDAHAEALYHLYNIANQLQNSERTAQNRQLLKSRYPNTHWASKL